MTISSGNEKGENIPAGTDQTPSNSPPYIPPPSLSQLGQTTPHPLLGYVRYMIRKLLLGV